MIQGQAKRLHLSNWFRFQGFCQLNFNRFTDGNWRDAGEDIKHDIAVGVDDVISQWFVVIGEKAMDFIDWILSMSAINSFDLKQNTLQTYKASTKLQWNPIDCTFGPPTNFKFWTFLPSKVRIITLQGL